MWATSTHEQYYVILNAASFLQALHSLSLHIKSGGKSTAAGQTHTQQSLPIVVRTDMCILCCSLDHPDFVWRLLCKRCYYTSVDQLDPVRGLPQSLQYATAVAVHARTIRLLQQLVLGIDQPK